jgi:hypothetical protein
MMEIVCAASHGYIDPRWGTVPDTPDAFFELLRNEDLFA